MGLCQDGRGSVSERGLCQEGVSVRRGSLSGCSLCRERVSVRGPPYGGQAGSTYPTGMLSCFNDDNKNISIYCTEASYFENIVQVHANTRFLVSK